MKYSRIKTFLISILALFLFTGCSPTAVPESSFAVETPVTAPVSDAVLADMTAVNPGGFTWGDVYIPEWNGTDAWTEINGNEPLFSKSDLKRTDAFEDYSELDELGRCGAAYANICLDLMPMEARGEIGNVRPTGWHTVKYNDLISGNYLYNRCHLIGFQLAGENANPKNLITGTRYLNIDGMLDFENRIDDYVEDTGNHVLYRVTPVFIDEELVARGVMMEAYSVEDGGVGIRFCVFAYNVQPCIGIDYATGESWRLDGKTEDELMNGPAMEFVLNIKSGKFHTPDCKYAGDIKAENRLELTQTLAAMLEAGYSPCGSCHPDEA